ncbi:MAG: hypothetical protein Kow0037_31680 [Calditrichia bacterium]
MNNSPKRLTLKSLSERLDEIEKRVAQLEDKFPAIPTVEENQQSGSSISASELQIEQEELEMQIGENWFARIGIIIMTLGIIFFLTYSFEALPPWFAPVLGLVATLVLFGISKWMKEENGLVSGYLFGAGWIVAFFLVLRLHFFSASPLIGKIPVEILLFLLISVFLWQAYKNQSLYLTVMGTAMGAILALLLDNPPLTFAALTALSSWTAFTRIRRDQAGVLIAGQFLVFFSHLLWFLNNPIAGRKIELVHEPHYHLYFILIYIIVFAMGNLFRPDRSREDSRVVLNCFLSAFMGFGLFLLASISGPKIHFSTNQFVAFTIMMALATMFWIKEESKISTFTYAMIAYGALSVAIISRFTPPNYFFWLCWQSLLVIVTALWFRSKIIVLANFIIFLLIFMISVILAGNRSDIAFSFGMVALLSARIMNWQKHRLDLRTEFMRNSYLVTTFVILPYAIYRALPVTWEIFGWICLAGLYFLLSLLLNNRKYRWMGIGTLFITIGYIFVIGIIRLEGIYRILSFLALGFVLVLISLVYSRIRRKQTTMMKESDSSK